MTTRTGLLALALAAALTGCASGPVYHSYSRFLTHLEQEDLDVLDAAGTDGARLIIGLLEMDGQWKFGTSVSGRCVEIEALRVTPRTSIDGRVIEAPPRIIRGPWRVSNPYVLHWAESRLGAAK